MNLSGARAISFLLFSAIACLIFFLFGSSRLGAFETVDEHFWKYERIPQYWHALAAGNWKKTAVNDKPGISVALFSGVGLLFTDPASHRIRDEAATLDGALTVYDASQTEYLNTALRLPLLFVNVLLLLYIGYAVWKATGNAFIALVTLIATALSPILIGISRIINPDALLWSCSAAAFFSYAALLATREKKFLAATAVCTGFALLSKYTASFLFPLFVALFVGHFLFVSERTENTPRSVRRALRDLLFILVGSLAVFALFLPAVFIKPILLWRGSLGFLDSNILLPLGILLGCVAWDAYGNRARILNALATLFRTYLSPYVRFFFLVPLLLFGATLFLGLGNQSVVPLEPLMLSAREGDRLVFPPLEGQPALWRWLQELFVQAYPFVFSLHPLVLLLVLFLFGRLVFRTDPDTRFESLLALLIGFFSIAYFALALSVGTQTNARYVIVLYPLFGFLAALGTIELLRIFPSRWRSGRFVFVPLALLAILGIEVARSAPFFFNYASPLLEKQFTVHDSWGLGQYEAAQFLNSLPADHPIYLWSDKNGLCQFLAGPRCVTGYRIDLDQTPLAYFVISKRGVERNYVPRNKKTGEPLLDYLHLPELLSRAVWRLDIDDRPDNFIAVIPVSNQ